MDETVVSQPSETASSSADLRSITSEVLTELSAESPPARETVAPTQPPEAAAPSVPQTAPGTAAPAPETAGTEKTEPGPIPYTRFKEVNERAKTAETRVKELEAHYVQPMHRDPVGYILESFREFQQDPQYANDPRLKSFAGRTLSGRATATITAPAPAEDAAKPTITPLVDSAGNKVYAAEDVEALLEWQRNDVLGKVKQELAPITEEREQAKQVAHAREVVGKVASKATSIMAEYRKAPGWTSELEPQVKARYRELREQGHGPESALSFAYQQIIVPQLGQQERKAVVTSLHNKTQASAIAPRSVTAPAKAGPVDTRDVARQVLAEAGAL